MEFAVDDAVATQQDLPLPPPAASDTVVINASCVLRAEGDYRVVVVAGQPVQHYVKNDAVAEAYAMVLLVDAGFARQKEVAAAFGCTDRTVRRNLERYHEGGMTALATRSGWRAGRRRRPVKWARVIERLKSEGVSNREIARRLGLTEKAIRKQVGPSEPRALQLSFRSVSASGPVAATEPSANVGVQQPPQPGSSSEASVSEPIASRAPADNEAKPVAPSLDVDASNRAADRLLACMGLLADAQPMFEAASAVSGAGVLCAVPLLEASGIFRIARTVYGEIAPAFYGTRTTIVTLLLMALSRIQRPEALKERDPRGLGRLLGLDRAPEVKTVRRKLGRLAAYHKADRLGQELARHRVRERGQLMGFLYVDGHVRAYHGKRDIPKAHVARMRIAMPATTDYWVNDQSGDPLFVMTAVANAAMTQMLPGVLAEVRSLVGDRRVTIVFDRGGFSPKLFNKLLAPGNVDILTYRKGKVRQINPKRFALRKAKIDGRPIEYRLHDQAVRLLGGKLRLRQVTRLNDNGHQTQVLTSRWDLADIDVAFRMFERWKQENFFKYLREEFLLDALSDYKVEADDPTRTVPNPARRAADDGIKSLRAEIAKLEQAFGQAAADNAEGRRPTMRGFKIAHGKLGQELRAKRKELVRLLNNRKRVPKRVEVRDITPGTVVKLATERKHLTNILKMVAYQAESDLLAFLRPHYKRSEDEGRTLLHELFAAPADIDVDPTELRITLHPLSAPHRTLAVERLCETLNATATVFPGSELTMRFAILPRPETGLAFPGPRPHRPAGDPPPASPAT